MATKTKNPRKKTVKAIKNLSVKKNTAASIKAGAVLGGMAGPEVL